jgi:hypothetical protein
MALVVLYVYVLLISPTLTTPLQTSTYPSAALLRCSSHIAYVYAPQARLSAKKSRRSTGCKYLTSVDCNHLTQRCSGNAIIVASSTAVVIGLSWGGVQFSWSSARVLVPLILGLLGFLAFGMYEAYVASHPIVRFIINLASIDWCSKYIP